MFVRGGLSQQFSFLRLSYVKEHVLKCMSRTVPALLLVASVFSFRHLESQKIGSNSWKGRQANPRLIIVAETAFGVS